jgi:hypothetical protein
MRKLKLNQPYASMVICGALQTVPNQWDDIKEGEKILIYADEVSDQFTKQPLDFKNEVHRKFLNELFFGNLPEGTYPVDKYLGYVIVSSSGTRTKNWPIGTGKYVFVKNPHVFDQSVEDFKCDIYQLDKLPAHPFIPKRMERKGDELIVPVGLSAWQQLRDEDEFEDVFIFWESYMGKIVPPVFANILEPPSEDDDEIWEVHFVYDNKVIKFATNYGVGWNMAAYKENGKTKSMEVFQFDLVEISPNSKLGFLPKREPVRSEKKSTSSQGSKHEWVHIIYTPMGGMTRWKRR